MTITTASRNIIRNAAAERDCRYRITNKGEVHFYGKTPNSDQTGWYFVGWGAAEVAKEIQEGRL